MDQAFLPPEIIINILSRLPVKTVIRCKCVCKSWLELLETPEFAKDHLSKSAPGLIVNHGVFRIFEFVDELELVHHGLHYNLITEFEQTTFTSTLPLPLPLPRGGGMGIEGSANGLVFLWGNYPPDALFVCNPITREYIELPCLHLGSNSISVTNGFGVSVTSGQYKVVRIFQECVPDEANESERISKSECWVYTLGTRAWRSIAPCPCYDYDDAIYAVLNGNLHWLVEDINAYGTGLISCFDLDTEVFSAYSPPPPLGGPSYQSDLVVFEECLCICVNSIGLDRQIVIWVMKEYGNENSWTKQFVFTKDPYLASQSLERVYPLKLFKDGDILLWGPWYSFYYSRKSNTTRKLDFSEYGFIDARLHIPSFLSLGSFAMETVRKF